MTWGEGGGRLYAINSSKRQNEPIIALDLLHWKALRPFIYGYSMYSSKFGTGNVKEPKILNVYQIISGLGNVVMEETFD